MRFTILSRSAYATALVALAACSDPLGTPARSPAAAPAARPLAYDALLRAPGPERITVTRTTETFELRGGRRVATGHRQKVSRLERQVAAAGRGKPAPVPARASDDVAWTELPPVGLTVEARRGAAGPNVVWRSRRPLLGVPGVEVEREGVGDSPALTLRFYENGALARTVAQSYRRAGRQWELVRRETTTPDGRFRDVVTVDRVGGRPSALPFSGDAAADASADWVPGLDVAQQQDCDPCKALRDARDAAFEAFLWQEATAIIVCLFTPPPADVLACVGVALKVTEAWHKFTKADNAYDACAANPPKCPEEEQPPPPGGGGGDEDDGTTTCYWEVWYNADTGEVLDSRLLYCETT